MVSPFAIRESLYARTIRSVHYRLCCRVTILVRISNGDLGEDIFVDIGRQKHNVLSLEPMNPENSLSDIESPCISVCKMNTDKSFCIGCWRTKDEIKSWKEAGDDDRLATLERARGRREAAGGKKRRQTRRRAS